MARPYRRTGQRPPGPPPGRSLAWTGKLGGFVREYSVARLAGDLGVDDVLIGRWARGDYKPSIQNAIAVVLVARAAGADLSLEDLYAKDFDRIRYRIRNQLPPL